MRYDTIIDLAMKKTFLCGVRLFCLCMLDKGLVLYFNCMSLA